MAPLTAAQIRTLLTPPAPPCVSLYMPTHKGFPDRREDPIRYKNLLKQADGFLREKYAGADVRKVVGKFEPLVNDANFWSEALDGLAAFGSADTFEVFRLPQALPERVVVADSFHVKPLLRVTQAADRFHVVGISRTEAWLWEGDRFGLTRIPDALPKFDDAVGTELTQKQKGHAERGGAGPQTAIHASGDQTRKDELDKDSFKFFREVGNRVLDKYTKPTGLPLVVCGLPDNVPEFMPHVKSPHLVPDWVSGDPGAFSPSTLLAAVWKVVEPRYKERLAVQTNDFNIAKSRDQATGKLEDIGRALIEGRVGTLMVDADKTIPGRVVPDTGEVQMWNAGSPDADDLLDDLAEMTLKMGGQVLVLRADQMPTETGAAAIFRFGGGGVGDRSGTSAARSETYNA